MPPVPRIGATVEIDRFLRTDKTCEQGVSAVDDIAARAGYRELTFFKQRAGIISIESARKV